MSEQLSVCFCDLQSQELVLNRFFPEFFAWICVDFCGNIMDISFRVRVWGPFHRRASIGRASRRLPSYFH